LLDAKNDRWTGFHLRLLSFLFQEDPCGNRGVLQMRTEGDAAGKILVLMADEREQVRMIISGGGTGGHLFPGIAVAEGVLRRFPGAEMLFVGTERQTDARVLANRSFDVTSISCLGLKGKGGLARLKALVRLPFSLLQALSIMKRFRPALVLGVGGYVTGPVLLAAKLKGIATCIHEQNSVPGMANRALGKFVDRVFLSMPGSEQYFLVGKRVLTGNPVRGELLRLAEQRKKENDCSLSLLVLGGSLGARRVNSLVTEALAAMKEDLPKGFRVIHQTGSHDEEQVRKRYEKDGISCKVSAFFTDMAAVYDRADLVVSTVHKAKGREWDRVKLADDFRAIVGGEGKPSSSEVNLLYVAVTRAQGVIDVSGCSAVQRLYEVDDGIN